MAPRGNGCNANGRSAEGCLFPEPCTACESAADAVTHTINGAV